MSKETTGARRCYRFESCNANICPLDPGHLARRQIEGESICAILRAASKNGRRTPELPNISRSLALEIDRAYEPICSQYGAIRRGLEKSAKSPSRLGVSPQSQSPRSTSADGPEEYPIERPKVPHCWPRKEAICLYSLVDTAGLVDAASPKPLATSPSNTSPGGV